jgi:hypothetical protein
LAGYKTCTMRSRRMAGGSIYHPASGPTVAATLCMGDKLQASDVCMLTTICNLLLMDRLKSVQDRHSAMPTQHTAHSSQNPTAHDQKAKSSSEARPHTQSTRHPAILSPRAASFADKSTLYPPSNECWSKRAVPRAKGVKFPKIPLKKSQILHGVMIHHIRKAERDGHILTGLHASWRGAPE